MIFGVDLRASPKRPSAVVALNGHSVISFLTTFGDDTELFQMGQAYQPSLIAIGAPLSLPKGLCCLETSCPCKTETPQKKGRQAELELARMGISCFFTHKRSIIRTLIYRGIELRSRLKELGHEVIEVYPHATKVLLFGDKVPPKSNPGSLTFMKEHLAPLVQGLDPHLNGLDRNSCDAVVNAYTAHLHAEHATDVLGTPEEGLLVLPRLPR
jgi:predicted nuclease with RNAse H fold